MFDRIYRVDPNRINEYGQVTEERIEKEKLKDESKKDK